MTRYIVVLLSGLGLAASACGPREDFSETAGVSAPTPRQYWEGMAPSCEGSPSKADCDDGDMVLFGGLLCASGDARGCDLVRRSQDGDGRWWRSPRRAPGNVGQGNSFSRDMALGAMLYLATTRDTAAAENWLDWIEDHRPCIQWKPFGQGCLIRGAHRFCTDDSDNRCTLTPANWGVLGRVFQHLGLSRNREMRQYEDADGDALWVKAERADPGYELHLAGAEVLLKAKMDASRAPREKAANFLATRQSGNPFFRYLKEGATAAVQRQVLSLCPSHQAPNGGNRRQWAWERDTAEQAWKDSAGWDCLFMGNLTGIRFY